RTVRLNLHRHLARATTRNRHQRHTMSPRRQHRLPKLQSKSVAYENLVKLERVIRTRQPQPLELRTHRRLPHRLSRPTKNRLRPLQLRRKSNPQILKRLLRVIIQRPLNILAQPGTPPLQNLTNGRQLVIGNVSNPQIPNVLTSPRRHLPLQSPLEKRLTASRVTFSSLRRVMRQRYSVQQCHGLALNLGIPTETASRANLPANSALGLKIKISLARMRHLALRHRAIQHRMRRHRLLNTRSKNLRLPQPLSPQSVNQVASTRATINRDLRELAPALDQEIDQPLRALRHRCLTDRLDVNAAIVGLQRARDSNMRAIRRELHPERAHARLRRLRNTLPPQPRPERLTPLLPLIPDAQALAFERLDRPQQLPHAQDRALARAVRERRVSLPPRRPIIRVSVLVRRQLHIHHVRVIARQRSLTPHREHLARIGRARRSANHEHQAVRCRVRRR